MTIQTKIICRLQVEGLHCWANCDIEEVMFLKNSHRHQFHIIATKIVTHADRDIEFIRLSHEIKNYLNKQYYSEVADCLQFDSRSCEMLALELLEAFNLSSCEVNEDLEGGSIVERI